ncbi:MAG: hypothetical protein JNL72_07400 [Flavipsychrobacter sp.]|nr:hypothetical protein [Flavipsychrobacter sp.]
MHWLRAMILLMGIGICQMEDAEERLSVHFRGKWLMVERDSTGYII